MNEFDFIIVGSGPSAIASAYELAKKHSVLIIEKGKKPLKSLYPPRKSVNNLYDPIFPIVSDGELYAFGQGGGFGGGSVVNGALFWPLPTHMKSSWEDEFGEDFTSDLNDNYEFWYKELDCKFSDENSNTEFNKDSIIMRDVAHSLSWNVVPVPRLLFNCTSRNNCGFGCDGKLSMDKYFEKVLKNKVDVLTESEVVKIMKIGNKVTGVKTKKSFYKAKSGVIVAAGATNSYYLLKKSKIVSKSFIQFHLNFKILVLHDNYINADKGTMFTYQIQEFMNRGILFMPTNVNTKSIKSCILNLPTEQQKYILNNQSKVAIYVVQIQPKAIGKLKQFLGFKYAHYNLLDSDYKLIKEALKIAVNWLSVAGFKDIVLPKKRRNVIEKINQCEISNDIYEFLSVHSTSANRMSLNPMTGNTDINGLVWGLENLWITDSSVLPSNIGESPQGVIMSNAKRICENINKN